MAAPEDRQDRRMLRQADHQRAWLGPNTNRSADRKALVSEWEKRLRDKGIEEEELTVYSRTINSHDETVNTLNDDIVRAFNEIASCRRELFVLYKNRAEKKSVHKKLSSISNLKKDIGERQQRIRARGGTYEKLPSLFLRPIRI